MVYGVGIDNVQISRMEKSLQKPRFAKWVFSEEELAMLEGLAPAKYLESAAGCFAAKEAFLKAAGVGLGGFALHEMAALRKESGQPYMAPSGKTADYCTENNLTCHLSITHDGGIATAIVILEQR